MYEQVYDPVGDSLLLSSIFAAIPIVVLFVLLGGIKPVSYTHLTLPTTPYV